MHGSVMIFLAVVPLATGAFGGYLVPLQIGAARHGLPAAQRARLLHLPRRRPADAGELRPARRRGQLGLDVVSAAGDHRLAGQTWWLAGIFLLGVSAMLGAVNLLATVVACRARGLTLLRMPFFVWAQVVTALLLLLAFPALQAAAVFQWMDRVVGTSFFLPSGLAVSNTPLAGRRRRQPAAVAAPVLVPGPSRGLRAGAAGDGHRRRGDHRARAPAAVALRPDGQRGARRWAAGRWWCGPTTCSSPAWAPRSAASSRSRRWSSRCPR